MKTILTTITFSTVVITMMLLTWSINSKIKADALEQINREWCNSKGGVHINKQCFKAEIISFYGD